MHSCIKLLWQNYSVDGLVSGADDFLLYHHHVFGRLRFRAHVDAAPQCCECNYIAGAGWLVGISSGISPGRVKCADCVRASFSCSSALASSAPFYSAFLGSPSAPWLDDGTIGASTQPTSVTQAHTGFREYSASGFTCVVQTLSY